LQQQPFGHEAVQGWHARDRKRAIQRELETPIAKGILASTFTGGHTVAVETQGNGLQFSQRDPARLPVLV
jgi:ATP-dependent Clp protease ATP-binding subunit ClpB